MGLQATFVHEGRTIDYTPVSDIAVGDVVALGKVCGIAQRAIAAGQTGGLVMHGVFDVVKTADLVFALGEAVRWNTTTKRATKTSSDVYMGVCAAPAAGPDDTVRTLLRSLQEAIAEQFGLSDLSDVGSATATDGNILLADGAGWATGKPGAKTPAVVDSGGAGLPIRIWKLCTAAGAGDVAVHTPVRKIRVLNAHLIARDANAANVLLHQGTAGQDDITDTKAKGATDDAIVSFSKVVEEKAEVAAGTAIKANFSAAASAIVVIDAVAIT